MKKLLALPILFLAGCAAFSNNATTQQVQAQYAQACAAYGTAFAAMVQLRKDGKLNQPQIDAVTQLDSQVTPICTGSLPTNPSEATVQITAAATTLSILAAQKGAQ